MGYSIVKLCGFTIGILFLILLIKPQKKEYGMVLSLSAGIVLMLSGIACLYPMLQYVFSLTADTSEYPYLKFVLKALGIATLTSFSAELCRDCGEGSLASHIEFLGKAATLALSMPLLKDLIQLVSEMIH